MKPTGAACWYRMVAAGSTSPWSLSSRSPSLSSTPHLVSLGLSLPLPPYPFSRSPSLSLSRFSPLPLSLAFFFSLSYRRPAVLSLEREPLDGRTKAAGCFSPLLLFCHSVLVSLRCSARERALPPSFTCHSLLSSLLVARWLVHWFHRCTGPGFVFFLSNYTVTCNRPCQLAAPFFRSSSGALPFFSSLCSQDPTWRATPSKGLPREEEEEELVGTKGTKQRARSDPPINPTYPSNPPRSCNRTPLLRSDISGSP